jgi:hypothetical protein
MAELPVTSLASDLAGSTRRASLPRTLDTDADTVAGG